MAQKTILLVDDEQGLIEALEDALVSEGYRVLRAFTGEEALEILSREQVDLVTVDIMLPPGKSLESETISQRTGIYLIREISRRYPALDLFCLSVVSDADTVKEVQMLGVRFFRKGETPLITVLDMIRSRITGIAYSSERDGNRWKRS